MSPTSQNQPARPPRFPAPAPRAPGPLGLPRAYWLLWLGMLVNRLGGAVFPFLAIYLTRARGLSVQGAGVVMGIYAAGSMMAGPIGGALADRIGRRRTLLLGTVLGATAMTALGLARSTTLLMVLAPVLAFVTDLSRPPLQAAVADLVPAPDRLRAYGLLYWALNLGFAGAATFAGAVADHSFTLLFVVDAATTLAFGAVVFFGVPETLPARDPASAAAPHAGFWAPFQDRAFVVLLAIQLLVTLVFQQMMAALSLDMRAHGLDTALIGRLLALNGVFIIVLQPLGLRATRRLAPVRLFGAGAALVGLGFGVPALAGGAGIYALAVLVFTLGEIAFSAAAPTLIADLAPVSARGRYHGAFQLSWGLSGVLAPAIGTEVMARFGARALWLACLGTGLCAAVLHATVTTRALARRRAERPVG